MKKPPVCLVVEGNDVIQDLISFTLLGDGFDVHTVGSGAHGIAAAASDPTLSLIVLDLDLPDMNGHDVARALRALCPAPLLFIMNGSKQDDMWSAMASGAAAYLEKPFAPASLSKSVRRLVPLVNPN